MGQSLSNALPSLISGGNPIRVVKPFLIGKLPHFSFPLFSLLRKYFCDKVGAFQAFSDHFLMAVSGELNKLLIPQ